MLIFHTLIKYNKNNHSDTLARASYNIRTRSSLYVKRLFSTRTMSAWYPPPLSPPFSIFPPVFSFIIVSFLSSKIDYN